MTQTSTWLCDTAWELYILTAWFNTSSSSLSDRGNAWADHLQMLQEPLQGTNVCMQLVYAETTYQSQGERED